MSNKFKSIVKIEVKTSYCERFLNICTKENINVLSVDFLELGVLHINISLVDLPKIKKIACDSKYKIKIIKKQGITFKLFNIRKRIGLLVGLLFISFVYLEISSRLVAIEINGTTDEMHIFDILSDYEIYLGMPISDIETRKLPSTIIYENDDILWCALNVIGNSLTVEVKMREETPEIFDRNKTSNIIAEKSGVIDSIDVKYGEQIVLPEQSFNEGDVLVSANISHYANVLDYAPLYVQSFADIYARISYEFDRVLPQNLSNKIYTGREKTSYAIVFQKKSYNLYENSGNYYEFYDKIVETKSFNMSKYIEFPFSLQIEKCMEYTTQPTVLTENYEILLKNSKKYIVSNNQCAVLNEKYVKTSNAELIRIRYKCETLEKIGILQQR